MISFSRFQALFADLSQNTTAENLNRASYFQNIEQRYIMQDFFANEGSYQIQTIGQTELTLATAVPIGSTSLTLASAWPYQTTQAQLTFVDGETVLANFTNGSTAVTWIPATVGLLYLLSGSLTAGATSATLASAWTQNNGNYLTSFSDGSTKVITYTKGSVNITWTGGLAGNQGNQIYTSTIAVGSIANIGGVQFYPFPPNYSKLKDITITVGVLKWTLSEVRTREEWDELNVFPYYASIPSKFFIYPGGDKGGQIGIWPIPSTTGNVITYNYKFRVPDLSLPDYGSLEVTDIVGNIKYGDILTTNNGGIGVIQSFNPIQGSSGTYNISVGNATGDIASALSFTTNDGASGNVFNAGTVGVEQGSTAVTGSQTNFVPTVNQQLESRWIQFSQPDGDGLWYQIQSINDAETITLYQPYQGSTITQSYGFTIGQMPLIAEDFQDMLLWKALSYYFTSIVDNPKKAQEYQEYYDRKIPLLKEYSGTNTINVNLSRRGRMQNPNLFGQRFGQTP